MITSDKGELVAEQAQAAREDFFDTTHLHANLKTRSVRGGAVALASQAVSFVLQLVSLAVLARLLTPNDFGLVAMVTAVLGFLGMVRDGGLSMATVQRAKITHEQISTLFWVNLAITAVLVLVIAALAPALAWFYGRPILTWITLALAGQFLLLGLCIQHTALLRRQMRFGVLASINLSSMAVGVAAAIAAAWYGTGYWALVIQVVATAAATSVGTWLACRWRPGLPVRGSGVRPMLAFGGNLTGFTLVNYFARTADNILIGWYWGADALGLFSRAYSLLILPLMQINAPLASVVVPGLSRLQDEPIRFRNLYCKALTLLSAAALPLAMFLLLFADEIIRIVLGPQWDGAAVIFRYLAISAFVLPILDTVGWLYIAQGRTGRMFKWGIFATIVLVASFLIGLPYGATGVALSYSIAIWLLVVPGFYVALHGGPVGAADVLRSIRQPLLGTLIAGAIGLGARLALQGALSPLPLALVSGVLMLGTYSVITLYFFRMWSLVNDVTQGMKAP